MLNLWRQLFSLNNKPEMYKYFNLKLCILWINKNVKIISSMYTYVFINSKQIISLNMFLIFTLVVLIYSNLLLKILLKFFYYYNRKFIDPSKFCIDKWSLAYVSIINAECIKNNKKRNKTLYRYLIRKYYNIINTLNVAPCELSACALAQTRQFLLHALRLFRIRFWQLLRKIT